MKVYFCYISLVVVVVAEVITLIKHEKVTCVITGESRYSGIELVPWVEWERPVEIIENWNSALGNEWKYCKNEKCADSFDVITDQRWEGFETTCIKWGDMHPITPQIRDYRRSFSFYTTDNSVFDVANYGNSSPSTNISQWLHFSLKMKNHLIEVESNGRRITKKSFHFGGGGKCAKVHKYEFVYSDFSGESVITTGPSSCIFMYVSVDEGCYLDVHFEKGDSVVNGVVEGFNQKFFFRKWRPFNITNVSEGQGDLHLVKRSGNSSCFWAIADLQKCRNETEFYDISSGGGTLCRTLKINDKNVQKFNFIDENLPFICSEVLGTSYPNCEKHKICVENGTCFCSWGFEGTFCDKPCRVGFWGVNCSQTCHSGCSDCDPVKGCTKCKKYFFGNQCQNEKVESTTENVPYLSTYQSMSDSTEINKILVSESSEEIHNSESYMLVVIVSVTSTLLLLTTIVIIYYVSRHVIKKRTPRGGGNLQEEHDQNRKNHQAQEIELRSTNKLFSEKVSIPVSSNFQQDIGKVLTDEFLEQMINYSNEIILQSNFIHVLSEQEKSKNRFRTILPGTSQVFLPASLAGSSVYINAVTVDCYNHPKRFIVTQQPLPNTIEDFWILVLEYKINTIVSLNHEHDPHCPKFWPSTHDRSLLISNSCHVIFLNTIEKRLYFITKVVVNEQVVKIIRIKKWDRESTTPESVTVLLKMWSVIKEVSGQILVTCYDGATASGLFVALVYLVEKIDKEHVCDVFSAVKSVRKSRFQFVQYSEQVAYLYEAAVAHVQCFNLSKC